ncbi:MULTISPECIES: photosystem II protein Y [unclassified Prochlorococcus]|jgi:photosystem II PsbY protein|nr:MULTISPECIES: photosystem II protein Y [unclassified Prochlorococcus]MED5469779.1 photosystem II protein Y [Cyanobacteriota bacterium]RPG02115.1 MAG: photosystem II protein Y [Prochlorococcus sp. TMED223]RZO52471.1 MAG: photosystem II protein Y [Prochlorococcus sp. MED-G132]HJN33102.1 photosystem II protein Y [Prochlorococcus sp.]KGG27735.1 Photosystem II protein PsbY [Prochlorococcus sp. MIT 0702]|tara:strand:- start:314 stop:430 length:117 start_codon:yes stop_codon:yes gene_type:complete
MILIVLLPILLAATWAFINIRGAALRQQGLGLVSKNKG